MPRTDDFTLETKKALAERSGYYCSFPGCGSITVGPSDESAISVSRSGMACHIAAAESGPAARRYDKDMSSQKRKSIENGIWCCYTHGKLIDTDEKRFSTTMLQEWKIVAETTVRIMQEKHCSYESAQQHFAYQQLVAETIFVSDLGEESNIIGNLLHDCGVELSWGREKVYAVRDLLIELTRNAFDHGKAKKINISINDSQVILRDDGLKFNLKTLSDKGRGGKMAALILDGMQSKQILWAYYFEHNENINTIALLTNTEQLEKITPCSITISKESLYRGGIEFKVSEACDDIYIIVPRYLVYSDIWGIQEGLAKLNLKGKIITIVSQHISRGVVEYYKKELPGVNILPINVDGFPFS